VQLVLPGILEATLAARLLEVCPKLLRGDLTTIGHEENKIDNRSEEEHALFMIYIAALNQFASPALVFQELADIVSRCGATYQAVKFCVACRTISRENLPSVWVTRVC